MPVSIEDAVLQRIVPGPELAEEIRATTERMKAETERYLEENNISADVRCVGSVAKGTFLTDPDIDLFVMFPNGTSREEMERRGLRIGEDILGGKRMYAEHPYITGRYGGFEVDMVPCYKVTSPEKMLSAVDRTPFHTDYVLSNTDAAMRDQIRLLKVFMKGIWAYGAEPNNRGFSGYLCELLVIRYGSFRAVLEAGAAWKEGISIAIDKKGPPMVAPLVFYDPVDPRRNVASAVHVDTFALFITACKAYLSNPSENFFFPSARVPLPAAELRRLVKVHGSRLLTATFKRPDINEDNLHSQMWKTRYALSKKLDAFSFNVLRTVHDLGNEELAFIFELERDLLSKTFKHVGPPVWVGSAESFLEKWRTNEFGEPFIEDGVWKVIAERMYFTAAEMLAEEAVFSGIGREIDPGTMRILDHDDTLSMADAGLLTELLDPKLPWEI